MPVNPVALYVLMVGGNEQMKHALQQILEQAIEATSGDESDVQKYSGRGMYGRDCLAITGWDVGPLMGAVIRELEHSDFDYEDVAYGLESLKTDSLGRLTIIYFPNIPYTSSDSSEDSSEEEEASV